MRPFGTHDLMVAVLPERDAALDPSEPCPDKKTCTGNVTLKPKPKPRVTNADLAALRGELRVLQAR